MAKRKPRDVQTRIPGTETVSASAKLMKLADKYADAFYQRRSWQDTENSTRPELAALMAEEDVDEIELESCTVTRSHIEEDRVTLKKRKIEEED